MRLILQPKSTKKAVKPYKGLMRRLFRFRFFILFRIYTILSLLVLLLVSKRAALTVFTSFSIIALNRKLSAHVSPVGGLTRFNELYNRLVSVNFARTLVLCSLSSAIYYLAVARPQGNLYTVEMIAGIPSNARGLNKAVKDGIISHSLVYLNENIVFNIFAAGVVAFVYSVYDSWGDSSCLCFKGHAASPRDALFSNFQVFALRNLVLSQSTLFLRVVYWLLRPLVLFPFYAGPWGGYYVAGTTSPSIFGSFIVSPLKWSILILIWQFAAKAFNAYYCRGPIHHGKTISQASNDPNATLLDGLNADRGTLTNLEAWLELQAIAQGFKERRVNIFADTGREKPVWKQVYHCFDSFISTVTDDLAGLLPTKAEDPIEEKPRLNNKADPRTIKISEKPVLMDRPTSVDQLVQKMQRKANPGQVLESLNLRVSSWTDEIKSSLLKSRYGVIFEPSESRKVARTLYDQPVLESAVLAISKLMEHSYDEDAMGYVQADIGAALDRFDKILATLSKVSRELGVQLPELESCLNTAFHTVFDKFKPHLDSLQVSEPVKARANYL